MNQNAKVSVSGSGLHILAMGLMLCDHLWAALFPAAEWLTCVGRIAYPIFAFLLVEGYTHTHDLRRYMKRMLIWAILSEIPFNLMYAGSAVYPYHQNVLWTFLLSLSILALIEKARGRFRPAAAAAISVGLALLGFLLGYAAMLDYYGVGVWMVLVFYFFQKRDWRNRLLQLLCLYVLNVQMLGGYYYEIQIFGWNIALVQQGFALLALVPIWLYQGRKGIHSKAFQYFCYGFYPGHMLVLYAARAWILR